MALWPVPEVAVTVWADRRLVMEKLIVGSPGAEATTL